MGDPNVVEACFDSRGNVGTTEDVDRHAPPAVESGAGYRGDAVRRPTRGGIAVGVDPLLEDIRGACAVVAVVLPRSVEPAKPVWHHLHVPLSARGNDYGLGPRGPRRGTIAIRLDSERVVSKVQKGDRSRVHDEDRGPSARAGYHARDPKAWIDLFPGRRP